MAGQKGGPTLTGFAACRAFEVQYRAADDAQTATLIPEQQPGESRSCSKAPARPPTRPALMTLRECAALYNQLAKASSKERS
ncbi:hypothetical protein SAMN00790413_03857 [Deinococcus hopiensis KR-140]|uniref:Uncharacterized protein n=1 Tax=Deinococcus hopiensis KR-140 TaxID=695939 RepID=A0A1W1UZQ9_9DEIO|nr:hypothetical protein SAMN00790413_03857 [Deinococcus hopiensis KR-140]